MINFRPINSRMAWQESYLRQNNQPKRETNLLRTRPFLQPSRKSRNLHLTSRKFKLRDKRPIYSSKLRISWWSRPLFQMSKDLLKLVAVQ